MRLIAARPRLLFIGDLPADPRDWYNRCVVDCFAKRSVVIR